MSKFKLTTQILIDRFKNVHGDRYDYSNTILNQGEKIVKIICKQHGEFEQRFADHAYGRGCKKCSVQEADNRKRKHTTESFIDQATKIHGEKYNYSKVDYKTFNSKVIIICKQHGEFEQSIHSHLSGKGCIKCRKTCVSNIEKFKSKAIKIHKQKYNYDNSNYINAKTKIDIICNIHGEFKQTPNDHLNGNGCQKCANLKKSRRWSHDEWINAGINSNRFDSFKVYIIKLEEEDGTVFYKIGKTYQKLEDRLNKLEYSYQLVKLYIGEGMKMSKLEKALHRINKLNSYTPKKLFGGWTECFNKNITLIDD